MPYIQRIATIEDSKLLAPLMSGFLEERTKVDPSMVLRPNFDFEQYVAYQISKPLHFSWILEYINEQQKTAVGFIFVQAYNEAPPVDVPENVLEEYVLKHPFLPRRVGSVFGLYVQEEHRNPETINLLIDTALQKAEAIKVTDIDVLISQEQTGIHALLSRLGFRKAAIQFVRHYDVPSNIELPSLHPPTPQINSLQSPLKPNAIPLRNIETNELVRNPQGEPVFIYPLVNDQGEPLLSSGGLPIYPTPVRNPQTNEWVFSADSGLVVCPLLYDEQGQIFECDSIPQFCPPAYVIHEDQISLKQDAQGNYVFREVEQQDGKILRNPQGFPVFKEGF